MSMPGNQIDLSQLFGQVVQSLSQNQGALNQADEYNKNHGDNMVEIFKLVTQALQEKKDAKPAAQLKYAASRYGKLAAAPPRCTPRVWRGPRKISRGTP